VVVAMVATVRVVVEGWVEEVAGAQMDWVRAARVRARVVRVAVHMQAGCQAPPLTPSRWGWGHTPADRVTREGRDNVFCIKDVALKGQALLL
jgi:hypothetical protein